ncbi:hypothetical protein GCM10007874_44940 [Labrys miyagiensis]|uniref:Threonine/homoserine/homoserine lactone efflux protein n=1 Tax=Labrys miyagiensis TaxID=346912 RepID=A0ABQ6CT87_9HYPH|nr:LysE family translocator [Labrys miyagiensis]GLS21477.1 hypothetical protein GCM10007874_44940 [Labrys miyagiensis]
MSPDDFAKLFLLVFPLMFSPGPTNFMCAAAASRHGVAKCIPMILGMDLMVFLPALLVGLGVGELFSRFPTILTIVQLIGAVVILVIGIDMVRSLHKQEAATGALTPMSFLGGMLVQTLNAKGLALLVIIYAQFHLRDASVWHNASVVAAYLTGLSLLSHFAWAAGGMWIARRFASARALRLQGGIYATMLVMVAIWLFVSAIRDTVT